MIFLLFIVFPIVEILGLIKLTDIYGFANVFLYLITVAVLGMFLIKYSGFVNRARADWPAHMAMKFLGGLLLIVPGAVSDVLALFLILPGSRHAIVWFLKNKMGISADMQNAQFFRFGPGGFQGGFQTFHYGQQSKPQERDARVIDVQAIESKVVEVNARRSDENLD